MNRVLTLALALVINLTVVPGSSAQDTYIRAGGVIDVEAGELLENQIIRIDGERIVAIGPNIPIPAGAEVIDLSNSTVMPGMVEAHTHLALSTQKPRDFGRFFFTNVIETTAYRAIQGVTNARSLLEHGFTSIRDLGNNGNYADLDLKRSIAEGWIPGPDMQGVGKIIAPFGGQFKLQPERPELSEPEYLIADTQDELRKAIHQNLHYGTDLIKIVVDDYRYIYSVEDIAYAVEQTTGAGVKLAAHVATAQGAKNAIAAGVNSLEHAWELDADDFRAMKEKGIFLVGTDFPPDQAGYFAGYDMALARVQYDQRIDRLKRGYAAGINIAFGADVTDQMDDFTRGSRTISFIDSYLDAGISPADLLRILTVN
ncbi:MAG: imidazolonepropionase-like amidohydrolase, partial [Rhodothermales bacterium]